MRYFLISLFLIITWPCAAQHYQRSLNKTNWQFKDATKTGWHPATVPGTVHTDLLANHLIPNPFLDENEKKVQWVEKKDWDYQTHFTLTTKELENEHINLVFDGLDTFAQVFLNGTQILTANNMFRQWQVPVKKLLQVGQNTLLICFKSTIKVGMELAQKVPFQTPESPRSFIRKAQYQFGWDWGPRLVTVGIWKDLYLDFWNAAKIKNVQINQPILTDSIGQLVFKTHLKVSQPGIYTLKLKNNTQQVQLHQGFNTIELPLTLKKPIRWQPNGWGKPYLYYFTLQLYHQHTLLDTKQLYHGFRTVQLIQKKDAYGKSFYFKVNGHPLYAKGVNWIPGDSFLPRVTKAKYQRLIQAVKAAHMNMIRVWGGGVYEKNAFYTACDKNGILVWQDFMFTSSFYPADSSFLNNVKKEITYQVERLQNHPCIALWCGNNEIHEAIVNWGYQQKFHYTTADSLKVWEDYHKLFNQLIPATLAKIIPKNAYNYWPSSPSIGWGHAESLQQGDSHYWGVWWGNQPFTVYNQRVGRFMSEYGFQGMPSIANIKAMFSKKPQLRLENSVIRYHQKHDRGWQLIQEYMARDYVIPKNFIAYDYVSQLLQARGMRIAITAHRRHKPYNMGSLLWQLNDCWPVTSWSGIDYTGHWKAMFYQAKRSFAPQAILAYPKAQKLHFYLINDALKSFPHPKVQLTLLNFTGKKLNHLTLNFSKDTLKTVLKNETISLQKVIGKADTSRVVLQMQLVDTNGKIIAHNLHYFVRPKNLQLLQPHITLKHVSPYKIEVSTDVLAKNIYLIGNTHFSDNFFDLLPHQKRIITLTKPLENITIMSLWNTMHPKASTHNFLNQ